MTYPVYHVPAGDVLPIMFSTYAGSTGASATMTGFAVTDIEVYKDGSVTQRASDAGYTLLDTDGTDFDGLTGIHGFSIDTGDNTDAGFYTVGAWFHVVVSAVTVDSQTVSFIAAAFRIVPAESIAGQPKVDVGGWLGTAPATPTVNGVPEVDVTHFNGSAGTFASGRPEVNATHIDGVAATNLRRAFENMVVITANGTPTSTTLTNATLTSATTDKYKGRPLYYLTGNLAGEIVEVTAYNGTTKTLTHTPSPSGLSATAGDLALLA